MDNTNSHISQHEVRIFKVFVDAPDEWFSNIQVAKKASVVGRTARVKTRMFATLGLLRYQPTFPGHRFKLAADWRKIERAQQILQAAIALDIDIKRR